VIHDCILGRSCDMDEMASDIRMHFAEMYKGDVLADWANEVKVDLPDDLIKNTLDIETVNESLYFFC
jgi:DNA-directed RNA polymerase